MIFSVLSPEKFDINSLYICPPHLYTVATLPWDIQKSHFQQYTSDYLRYLRRKQTATVVLQLICLLTAVYCGWLCGPAVEHRSLAGVLSLSCARLVADG